MDTRAETQAEEEIPAWLLGLPVTVTTTEGAVERILRKGAARGGPCWFVATSNVDFLVKALAWLPGRIRHPELVEVLRGAEMNTADGMPLVWAARWLGNELPERVSGSDLVPLLAKKAAERGIPVFLLGGKEEITAKAAEILRKENPGLQVAGVECPFVHTEGGRIAFEAERDRMICDKIRQSGAGILFIGFGNPKQEMWFQRNQFRLDVPVALGVGGTFNFIAGEIARAPEWMQKAGLEWLFRFWEEPARLWKRYAVGMAKFAAMTLPAVVLHSIMDGLSRKTPDPRLLPEFYSGAESLRVYRLPGCLDMETAPWVWKDLENLEPGLCILDASRCGFLDSAGLGLLWKVVQTRQSSGVLLFAPGFRFRILARIHRAWDFLQPWFCPSLGSLAVRIADRFPESGCYTAIEGGPDGATVWFLGNLVAKDIAEIGRSALQNAIGRDHVTVDLTYCRRVDAEGLALLMQLRDHTTKSGKTMKVSGVSPQVRQAMEVAGVRRDLTTG